MEEQHAEMDLERELRPDLWQTLPPDLIDCIIRKLLADLPFSSIFRFCCVFKQWKDLLLSKSYILLLHRDSCILFNPRRGVCESVSLRFCADAEGLRLQDMKVSCREGLLLLSHAANDEVIVCNPLTRRWTRVRGPSGKQVYNVASEASIEANTTWRVALSNPKDGRSSLVSSKYTIAIKLAVYSNAGLFHLTLAHICPESTLRNVMTLRDSRCTSYQHIRDVPNNFCFIVQPTLFAKQYIILGFYASPGGYILLTYDVQQKTIAWVSDIETVLCTPNATSSTRKVLIATVRGDHELEFLEMRNVGQKMILATSPFPPPRTDRPGIAAASEGQVPVYEVYNTVCREDGDFVHYICMLTRSGRVEASVWTQNRVNMSDRISNWEEWQLPGLPANRLPSAGQFHIFKPSFLSTDDETPITFAN